MCEFVSNVVCNGLYDVVCGVSTMGAQHAGRTMVAQQDGCPA